MGLSFQIWSLKGIGIFPADVVIPDYATRSAWNILCEWRDLKNDVAHEGRLGEDWWVRVNDYV